MKARLFLASSVLGNAALAGLVVALMLRKQPPAATADAAQIAAVPEIPASRVSNEAPAAPSQSFRWSQIESPDYPTYIANLRAIGCPERTIADLITADVDSLYAGRRRHLDLETRVAATGSEPPSAAGRQDVEARRESMRRDESELVARLLGAQSAASTLPASTALAPQGGSSPAEGGIAVSQPAKPAMPLVFANVGGNPPNSSPSPILSPAQQAVVSGLRDSFVEQVGGAGADPSTPEYAQHWQQAQPSYDQRMKVLLGYQAYQQFQLHGGQQGAGGQQAQ
jgi:hypothetical protein